MSYLDSVSGLLALARGRTPKPPQDLLPNLPLDTFLEVANHLSLLSLFHLTQTCSRLRGALLDRLRLEARRASKQELLECLAVAAKACPDAWACQECTAIHDADYRDTPHRRALACPRLRYIPLHSGPRGDDDDDDYQLHHHHVQLALKYSQLENLTQEQKDYLQKLLAPYTRTDFRINPQDARGNLLIASYILTPEIVNGRYVRKSTWTFSPWLENPSLENAGAFALCCHLPSAPMRCTEDGQITRRWHGSLLANALSRVFSVEDTAWGHCHFCALEFEVTPARRGKGLTVEAWQDLGPEGSIYHANWRAAAWDSRQHSIVEHMVQNRLAGSDRSLVRKLYGEWGLFRSGDEVGGEQSWVGEAESWAEWYISHSALYHPLEEAG